MYKILNNRGLGVAGKQNELIELALTHGFNGVEVDMVDLVGRHDALGKQFACQFLQSAKIDLGTFELPIDFGASDEDYAASLVSLETQLDLAKTLNSKCCYAVIHPNNAHFSFQECFEKHQTRIQELSEKFAENSIKIGLAISAPSVEPAEGEFRFIHTADELITLVKAIGQPNVGIALDAWDWIVAGGNVEQLVAEGIGNLLTEVRLADVAKGEDSETLSRDQRSALPGDALDSFSVKLCKAILESGAELPMSVSTEFCTFSGGVRNTIVGELSKQLDLLIAGEDPALIRQAEAEAEESSAESEEGTSETSEPAAVASNTE